MGLVGRAPKVEEVVVVGSDVRGRTAPTLERGVAREILCSRENFGDELGRVLLPFACLVLVVMRLGVVVSDAIEARGKASCACWSLLVVRWVTAHDAWMRVSVCDA